LIAFLIDSTDNFAITRVTFSNAFVMNQPLEIEVVDEFGENGEVVGEFRAGRVPLSLGVDF
jgi:hypothetical protein